ncbi:MAG: PBP1A family penicillin-binding protein [Acidobacteria bacterium]|nr:PBP1A family penicillin-binding protein [Acidobacteriota bacterium]
MGSSIVLGCLVGVVFALFILKKGAEYPELEVLRQHKPKTFTRVYDRHGNLIDIFSSEKRILLDFDDIPINFVHALVAVEDEDFFEHFGVSPFGILSAIKDNLLKNSRRGASTLTQQLVKNITKDSRNSYSRKFKEQLLAVQLETLFTKQEIFAMYANEIALGNNQFGIEAAARFYFGKSVGSLNLVECATLAGVPQAPSRFNPYVNPEACTKRRNIVLERMAQEGYISFDEAKTAKKLPLIVVDHHLEESKPSAGHFVDKVREYLFNKYGEERVRSSGWDVHTTLDLELQVLAENSLQAGIREVDKNQGYRPWDCPSVFKGNQDSASEAEILDSYFDPTWHVGLQDGVYLRGLVTKVEESGAKVRVGDQVFSLSEENVPWIRNPKFTHLFKVGDVPLFLVKALDEKAEAEGPQTQGAVQKLQLILDQEPQLEGAFLAVDPENGDLLAMVGGYDYSRSKFNRAEQAKRQVGSAFKPFVYGAALEQGYTLSDLLFDEPTYFIDPTQFYIDEQGEIQAYNQRPELARARRLGLAPKPELYEPKNFYLNYVGSVTLRQALAQSKNIVAVKLLNAVGYENVLDYINRLGLLKNNAILPYPSMALGAFEMSLLDVCMAYNAYAENGVRFDQRFITLIIDRKGQVIEQNAPRGEQIISPENAFLVNSVMQSVISEPKGTAHAAASLGLPLAGKTGTTDDYTDAWFVGFHPKLVVGVWVGHDTKRTIGRNATGGNTALPVFIDFFKEIKDRLPKAQFQKPDGIVEMSIDKITGKRLTSDCDCDRSAAATEYFLKQTEPVEICRREEQERAQLPWYLQKESYSFAQGGRVEPSRVFIDADSQRRALKFLENLKASAEPLPAN